MTRSEWSVYRHVAGRCFLGMSVVIACGLATLTALSAAAEEAGDDALLAEQLATGEFAPALDQARQAPPERRDALLGAVAKAQARAGEQTASLATIGSMRDDLMRSQALSDTSSLPDGAHGGGGGANFGALIDLIQSTVAPTTWDEVGGPGAIKEYQNGVLVDALGFVRPVVDKDGGNRLNQLRQAVTHATASGEVRRSSPLRKISLPRLEREIQMRRAAGQPLDDEMLVLAGLERIRYVFVYPETGDVVLAGPAGDWTIDHENRLVSVDNGRPVVQLDDFVVVTRHIFASPDGQFGCSIDPTEAGLAKAKAFLDESSKKPVKSGQRGKWLAELRDQLGRQKIRVFGIDPNTRVASAIVEADYRMKLVGVGLEEGTKDVPSYLEMIKPGAREANRPMDVLRWWFTVNYDAVATNPNRDVYELRGQGVKVLSENEMLTATGQQVHTGQADPLNAQFAHNFTRHFDDLARKYPVYADLQNIFDLALAASLLKSEGLADRANWHMVALRDDNQYAVARGIAPQEVETVINHRVVNRTTILAQISGGVNVNCRSLVSPDTIVTDRKGQLGSEQQRSAPGKLSASAWWWD
ncbi:MAG TPA: DUF1598 domain-containing protein [Pirellulales bacterium]|nr:DUF1598 domain-containing protein [Pirellulales bacterium]